MVADFLSCGYGNYRQFSVCVLCSLSKRIMKVQNQKARKTCLGKYQQAVFNW